MKMYLCWAVSIIALTQSFNLFMDGDALEREANAIKNPPIVETDTVMIHPGNLDTLKYGYAAWYTGYWHQINNRYFVPAAGYLNNAEVTECCEFRNWLQSGYAKHEEQHGINAKFVDALFMLPRDLRKECREQDEIGARFRFFLWFKDEYKGMDHNKRRIIINAMLFDYSIEYYYAYLESRGELNIFDEDDVNCVFGGLHEIGLFEEYKKQWELLTDFNSFRFPRLIPTRLYCNKTYDSVRDSIFSNVYKYSK